VATVPPDAEQRARRLGLPADFALVVGTLEPRKGLDVALAALAEPAWPDLPLVVIGPSGWGSVQVPDLPDGALHRLGQVSDEDLAVAYDRASVLLVPSRSEGFGLPVLEGMAHGVPVVTSDAPALLEVGGDAVLVAPIGNAAALAGAAKEALHQADRLADAGRRRAASATWIDAAEKCLRIYRTVI
jgi:glycosyltransferase involved in cell wall biosynthesis